MFLFRSIGGNEKEKAVKIAFLVGCACLVGFSVALVGVGFALLVINLVEWIVDLTGLGAQAEQRVNYVMFVLFVIALNAAVIWFLLIWPPYDRGKGDD